MSGNPFHDPKTGEFSSGDGGSAGADSARIDRARGLTPGAGAGGTAGHELAAIDMAKHMSADANDRRFHLSFEYKNPKFEKPSTGNQVVMAPTLEAAASYIARERGLKNITIKSRHLTGKPASEAETINKKFEFGK